MANNTCGDLLSELECAISQSQEELLQLSQDFNEDTRFDSIFRDVMAPSQASEPAFTKETAASGADAFTPATAFIPPPSAQRLFQDGNTTAPFAASDMPNLQSIEDFEKEHANTSTPAIGRRPEMIPFRKKPSSENVVKFQESCDQLNIRPEFTFDKTDAGFFSVKVVFGSKTEVSVGSYPSKKEAKEAVCERALLQLVEEKPKPKGAKRKSVDIAAEPEENFVGVLQEYTQRKRQDLPQYQESFTTSFPIKFGCTLTIQDRPHAPFGYNIWPFNSKKEAKTAAAKEAVLWLRENGKLHVPADDAKRRRFSMSETVSPEYPGPTQVLQDAASNETSTSSLPSLVNQRAVSLGFCPPRYDSLPSLTRSGQLAPGSYLDVAAYFNPDDTAKELRLAGPIGQVCGIYGAKAAKNACCLKVLQVLEEIERSRKNNPQEVE